ncbi:Rtf2 domain containing protein [Trichuris trichiura]|uniref:Replication termination factor 2 n=1 Tax=Trichuris trichiura TaxID=36087 RepID=A0A077Z878_TRITR|nr:Rtf2 domain containing protein [Trichuris trichiura]
MGCDGGTIPTRGELVRTKKKAAKVERQVANAARWKNCSLTQQRLKRPVVASRLGKMYNKEAVIEALIKKKTGAVFEGLDCIDSLKDVKELKLTKNPAYDTKSTEVTGSHHDSNVAEYMCPIAGVEMNGNYRFVVLWSCGCVISEKAMKEIEGSTCANCGTAYSLDDVVVIYGTDEEVEAYRLRVNNMRIAADTRKHAASCIENGVNGILPFKPLKKKVKVSSDIASNQLREARKLVKTSIQDDPTTSKAYKSLFTTSKEAKERPQPHWVTYNPLYY